MSAFSNIPPQAVLPLDAYDLDELKRCADRADQRLLEVDFGASRDKREVLGRIGTAFALPKHFGHNLDALYDCMTDLQPLPDASRPGFVVILHDIPETRAFGSSERDALLDVFRDAAEFFYDRKTAFRVFYSVARPS